MDRINQRADVFVVHLQDELSRNAQSLSELKMGGRQMHRDLLAGGWLKGSPAPINKRVGDDLRGHIDIGLHSVYTVAAQFRGLRGGGLNYLYYRIDVGCSLSVLNRFRVREGWGGGGGTILK